MSHSIRKEGRFMRIYNKGSGICLYIFFILKYDVKKKTSRWRKSNRSEIRSRSLKTIGFLWGGGGRRREIRSFKRVFGRLRKRIIWKDGRSRVFKRNGGAGRRATNWIILTLSGSVNSVSTSADFRKKGTED